MYCMVNIRAVRVVVRIKVMLNSEFAVRPVLSVTKRRKPKSRDSALVSELEKLATYQKI